MVRRVVFGLSVLGLCGTFAIAAPIISVEETGANLQAGQFVAGQSYTFNVYVSGLNSATTTNPAISGSKLLDYHLTFKMDKNRDGTARDNSDQSAITITSFQNKLLWPTGQLVDEDVVTKMAPYGAIDGGATGAVFLGDPPALGDTKTLLATFSISLAANADATNSYLYVAAGHRGDFKWSGGPGDGSYDPNVLNPNTMLTVMLNGQPAGVANTTFGSPNVEASGLALVPEPATIALLLAACGGGLVSRRRRA